MVLSKKMIDSKQKTAARAVPANCCRAYCTICLPRICSFMTACTPQENMTFEFHAAWQKMVSGGVLVSDDIPMSKAFARFIRGKEVGLSLVGSRFGVAIKR
jgi:hypothetical protein